jgi:hypothetical protein
MFDFKGRPRKIRNHRLGVDALEDRRVLSAGMGSTFAIIPGKLAEAGKTSTVDVKLDPTHFTAGNRGRITLGIDVAGDPSAPAKPVIAAVKAANGRNVPFQHSRYSRALMKAQNMGTPISTAVTMTLQVPRAGQAAAAYQVQVKGTTPDSGDYLLGFYLPGDVDGDGVVSKDDVAAIASKFGRTSTDDGYSFDADANRDGKIDAQDLRLAGQNIGARTTISPVSSVNLDPASDTGISDRVTDQRVVKFTGNSSSGATVNFQEIDGKSIGGTATVGADGKYSIDVPIGDGSNTFKVTTSDSFGQTISGGIAPVVFSANPPKVVNTIPTRIT